MEFISHSDDIKANVTMHGDKMEKDGVNVYHFSDMSIKLKVHKGKIHLSNLFNGDKQLGERRNLIGSILNE
jgi:Haemolymph juvenile hormone binding protein (JHBP).